MQPKTQPTMLVRSTSSEAGGATLAVLSFAAVTSLVFGAVLIRTMSTYRQVSHIASWQEALHAAEAGSDTAMAELRKTLISPETSFTGWVTTSLAQPLTDNAKSFSCPQLTHDGEGNTRLDMAVTIDQPPELVDGNGRQWFRIRSTGTTYLAGPGRVTSDKRDHLLRRLSFIWNPKTHLAVAQPQTTRLVELIVKPSSWENAITSDEPIKLNNQKIVIDSYDSRSETKSTNGRYDFAKRQQNGDLATNSQLIDAGDAHIYGDAYTNAGVVEAGANITGEQRNDFYQELLPIAAPSWPTFELSPVIVSGNTTLTGGTKENPKRYKLGGITIAGSEVVTFAPSAPGVESYIEIWLTGDLRASGSGTITIQPNTNVKIFLDGNVDIKGNGTFNAELQPGRLQILGIEPPSGQTRTMNFAGNGVMVAAIYAPNHNVSFGATGATGTMWGSLSAKDITMGGTTYIHYDESLADTGHITDFRIKNWFEDAR